jgi:hypothetical protein
MAEPRSLLGEQSALARYFGAQPGVAQAALSLVADMCAAGEVSVEARDFLDIDACLGFMLPLPHIRQVQLSRELRLCREAVHCFNKKLRLPAALSRALRSADRVRFTPPLDRVTYTAIIKGCRHLSVGLGESYLRSCVRVYYREKILATVPRIPSRTATSNCIRALSAFLLFDDDVMDLSADLKGQKSTVLIEFLSTGGELEDAIRRMCALLNAAVVPQTPVLLRRFAKAIASVYEAALAAG